MAKQIDEWTKTAARYHSEPEAAGGKGEGTASWRAAPSKSSTMRDDVLAKYHHYEVASAAFQIGIVLASATVITGMVVLSFLAGGLGLLGLASWRSACSRRTPCICSERDALRRRCAHAAADAPEQPHRAAGALAAEQMRTPPDPRP